MPDVRQNLAQNIRRLREARGLSQRRMADLSSIPRPTWTSLETGAANPTLVVLNKVAQALNISIEELIGAPRSEVDLIPAEKVRVRRRQGARLRPLVPDPLPGLEISRMELVPAGRMIGVPHTVGTREYLTCEQGNVELIVAGQSFTLKEGDTLIFRGDQPHSYLNPDRRKTAVAISVVCFAG